MKDDNEAAKSYRVRLFCTDKKCHLVKVSLHHHLTRNIQMVQFFTGMYRHGNEKLLRILVRQQINNCAVKMKMCVGFIKTKSINQFPSEATSVDNLAPVHLRC